MLNIFYHCSDLKSITVQDGNTVYDSRGNCNAIIETASNTLICGCQTTVIPTNVTSIGNYAFSGCTGLTSINIPSSVNSIGRASFLNCRGLTSVTIPSGVTNIGDYAFYYCRNLPSVTSLIEEPFEISRNVFDWIPYNATLYVPKGTKEKYETTSAWNEFQNIVELDEVPTGVETVSQEYGAAMVTERYALDGQRIGIGQRGLNIVRMSNGTARKVIVK